MTDQGNIGGPLERWVAEAHEHMEKGRPEQAADAYLKALDAAPDDPDLLSELGVAYEELGRPDQSIELHRKALGIEPDAQEFRVRLASAYLAGENPDQALPLLEQLLRELRATHEEVDPELRDAVHEGLGQAIHLQIGALLTVLPDGARISPWRARPTRSSPSWTGRKASTSPTLNSVASSARIGEWPRTPCE